MKKPVELIAEERQRQISKEGFSTEHDDSHKEGELALAASCYVLAEDLRKRALHPFWWPWEAAAWKPSPENRLRELVKAGALIVAELERLQRNHNI